MPAPIELFHRTSERDLAFPLWGPNYSGVFVTENAAFIITSLADWDANDQLPPPGTLLWLTHMQAQVTPGTGVTALQFDLSVFNRNTNTGRNFLSSDDGVGVAFPGRIIKETPLDFPLRLDRDFLSCSCVFSAANASNRIQFQWLAHVVPQGQLGY